jgi:exodeoxyribonuclease III
MKVISCNLNGIRSATQKQFWPWLHKQRADVICLQEIRATEAQFPPEALEMKGYHRFVKSAERPGYSGVAIYTKIEPKGLVPQMGHSEMDAEGRYLEVKLDKVNVVSAYFPSGSSGVERQAKKYEFLDHLLGRLKAIRKKGENYIICGDWNIAHKEIDLKNWKSNQKNSGFLPEERAWMDKVINELGYVDAFRVLNAKPEQYTWWSNRGQARAKNVGWRIDYQIISPELKSSVQKVDIYTDEFFSDHAPLTVQYKL